MSTFIIIEHEPLTLRLKEIWNICELQTRGISVQYWDLSHLISPNVDFNGVIVDECVEKITSFADFNTKLAGLDRTSTIVAVELFMLWYNRAYFHALKMTGLHCIKVDLYANTVLPETRSEKLLRHVKNFSFKGFFSSLLTKVYKKIYLRNFYQAVFSSSSFAQHDFEINHPDYEQYIYNDSTPFIKGEYIVFIDIFFPKHHEQSISFGEDLLSVAEDYYTLMQHFFDYLEEKFKMQVVVAAHPKSDYKGIEFGNRPILKWQTSNLIKFSSLIVTHISNSLSYICLSDKPFVFVYPDSFTRSHLLYNYIRQLSRFCKMHCYNLDKDDWANISFQRMSPSVRERYIHSFLTTSLSSKKRNVDILYDYFQSVNLQK